MQRGIEIEFQAEGEWTLALHVESMAALLDNLVSNAIKYSPENGRVMVGLADAAGGVRLTVRDQGPGVAEGLRQKVFERFYRVPGQEQSSAGWGWRLPSARPSGMGGRSPCPLVTMGKACV
jgi:two-component system sensor histidine kinase QseC